MSDATVFVPTMRLRWAQRVVHMPVPGMYGGGTTSVRTPILQQWFESAASDGTGKPPGEWRDIPYEDEG